MTAGTDEKAQALAAADLLERWADAVPMWDAGAGERWDAFAGRRYAVEKALEERLRKLPGCRLRLSFEGTVVDLLLAGIHVRSHACLAGACRAWAAEVRQRAGD